MKQAWDGAVYTAFATLVCLCVALVIASPCGAQEVKPSPAGGLAHRVMTFNIRVGYGVAYSDVSPWRLRKQAKKIPPIIEAIRSIDPDVIGLQEVYGAGQARKIAKALGMEYEYSPHPGDGHWWGLALLSRHPIQACEQANSSATRGIMVCRVSIDDKVVTLINVHKDHRITDGSSINAIVRVARRAPPPVIVLGDFNISPVEPRYDAITTHLADTAILAGTESAETALIEGTFQNGDRIDYIFVDPQVFAVSDPGITTEEHWAASDHLGYYADLIFRK